MATETARRAASAKSPDLDKFRLRRFVERLIDMGEVEVHDEAVALAHVSPIVEATDKAVLFRKAGPERCELVANVMGGRRRLAAALEATEDAVVATFQRRLDNPQPMVEIQQGEAPVQDVVLTGKDADFTKLPFHPQHEYDGSVYLTSGIDYIVDPETGLTNVGCRRLSLRGRQECLTNITAPSHLREIFKKCVARGERLPVSFTCGAHPIDFMAAGMRIRTDEVAFIGTLRGEPVPLVKCVTNDIRVPADAEIVIEGYFDERGYIEPEGPYGEYMGFYGPVHLDPIFHLTAITMRKDALHQSLLHGSGRILGRMESAQLGAIRLEAEAVRALRPMGIEVLDVYQLPNSGEGQHIRVRIRQTVPGQGRRVIAGLFAALPPLKHIFVVDEDIDIRSEDQMDWALGTRFQADRDLVVYDGMIGMPMDPSLDGRPLGAKAGFDLTRPVGRNWSVATTVSGAKTTYGEARYQTVHQALESAPHFFTHLMESVGSRDGREVALALDELRRSGRLGRDADGRYHLAAGEPGRTAQVGLRGHDPNEP